MLTLHQNYVILILAFLFSLLILISLPIWHGPDFLPRVICAAALFLVARDVIAGTAIARGKRQFNNPSRWVYAFYHALYFGVFMMLFIWQGPDMLAQLALVASIGAVLFAAIMAFLYYGKNHEYAHHFNTKNDAANSKFSLSVFYLWPMLTTGIALALILADFTEFEQFFLPLIFIGFLMPKFSRLKKGSYIWTNLPRLVGFCLLGIVLILAVYGSLAEQTETLEMPEPDTGPQPIYQELSQ